MTPNDVFDTLAEAIAEKVAAKLRTVSTTKKLMTVKEAAMYVGRSPGAVQQLVARGELPAVRGGRRVHVAIEDLDRWIKVNRS